MATTATQSSSSIEAATRRHTLVFAVYIGVLIFTALLIAVLTWLVEKSGNSVQDAIQNEASTRIETARNEAAQANRIAKQLDSDLTTEKGKVAGLQQAAADAITRQHRVEIELAKQQERAANAEKGLAQLRQVIQPRHLNAEQESALVKMLSGGPQGPVEITTVLGDGEATEFASEIDRVLKAAGWTVTEGGPSQGVFTGPGPIGFWIAVRNAMTAPPYAARIQRAFFSIGVPLNGAENAALPERTVQILIGHKPNPL